jgi:hypothetical protein
VRIRSLWRVAVLAVSDRFVERAGPRRLPGREREDRVRARERSKVVYEEEHIDGDQCQAEHECCAATPDPAIGAGCALATTADTLVPGTPVEGRRAIWQTGAVSVTDGGPDGLAATTAGNTVFMRQGVFVP